MHGSYFSRESDAAQDDGLGCARGLINGTPLALILWGVILGALIWVL